MHIGLATLLGHVNKLNFKVELIFFFFLMVIFCCDVDVSESNIRSGRPGSIPPYKKLS